MRKSKAQIMAELKAWLIRQLKSMIGPLIILAIIVAGVLVIMYYNAPEEEEEFVRVNTYEGTTQEMVLESDKIKFVMDPTTTHFTVTNKDTGKVWRSAPEGGGTDPIAMNTEKEKLQSTVLLTYGTIKGVDILHSNYKYSISKGIYDIEQGEDYIKVYYSIGDIDKEYMIPPVLSVERYNYYTSLMEGQHLLMVSNYYKKTDINNLGKKENAEELIARYPMLANEVCYILRDGAQDNIRVKLEEYFAEAGYSEEEYAEDKTQDTEGKSSDKPVFNVSLVYRLDGDDLIVEAPFDDMDYKKDYPIYYLSILPYFGAGTKEDEGFLLVPEGGGSLINFNNGKTAQNYYYANIYGWDMAQNRTAKVHDTEVAYNVFGISSGDDSYLCIIDEGSSYGAIQADISGRDHSYNYVNTVYNITHREKYDIADKSNEDVYVYEPQLPAGEKIVQRYRFVDSGDYVDMAKNYRDYLADKYEGYFDLVEETQTPLVLDVLGSVDQVEQVVGVPVSRPVALTTYDEAVAVIEELAAEGVDNARVKLSGWVNGGVKQKILTRIKPINRLGGKKDLTTLISAVNDMGSTVYLNAITNYAKDSDMWDGFFVYTDSARKVSKEKAELYEYNTVTYAQKEWETPYYLLRWYVIDEMISNIREYAAENNAHVSFQDLGDELSADYYRKNPLSREAAKNKHANVLKEMNDEGNGAMINFGNDYAIAYADMVTNMDLGGYAYSIIDKTVPFYQLAIHGHVNYTGEALNLTQDFEHELLKSAESGAGLAFSVMDETTFALQKTLYTKYFGSEYDAWHERIVEIYNRYNNELGHVFNQEMVDHEFITDKVVCTTYADGTKVYVNYHYDDYKVGGVTVPARDYKVVK